ncbi:hypothetical protein P280DRAFT_485040 [Massarina eburnea CBS 473.64]|uniref:Uncharacterized protein n=1 Tax=Massarina eburnea CBS 473.64 TaxID=1395130 RepID=A0A6A6RIT3_9PLEO|nr:hypothetical protein P280DRAFT_485040 [Massarina eburnea CBS 473.64]
MPSKLHTFIGSAKDARSWIEDTLHKLGQSDPLLPSPNLDNKIHSIFDFKRFRDVDKDTYRKMELALQLATLWLTDDRMLDWFYHNTVGILKFAETNGLPWPFLAQNPKYADLLNPRQREAARKLWMAKLKDLSKVLKVYMYQGNDDLNLFGCTYDFSCDLKNDRHDPKILMSDRVYQDENGMWRSRESKWPYTGKEKTKPAILVHSTGSTLPMRGL